MRPLFLLPLFFLPYIVNALVLSTTVGRVENHVVTSREVSIHFFMDQALFGTGEVANLQVPSLEGKNFSREVTNLLLERVVFLESKNFAAAKISDREVREALESVQKRLKGNSNWKALGVTENELQEQIGQLLQAKKFIQFKAESSQVAVTDAEARKYFSENQSRFGNSPYENFEENIKSFLTRQQSEQRLKNWFEVLQAKYKVRNFLSEM